MALSRARPMRNSSERSVYTLAIDPDCRRSGLIERTVDTLLVLEGLTLLRPVPLDDQTVSEGQGRGRVGSSTACQSIPLLFSPCMETYTSSQLKMERAKLVSTWRTTSDWNRSVSSIQTDIHVDRHTSKSSLLPNSLGAYRDVSGSSSSSSGSSGDGRSTATYVFLPPILR